MKRFLFSIALLFTALAGCSNHEGESAAPKSELNVMSYNIRYANASDKGDAAWDARKEASVTMIRDVKPDVIGMQEPRFSQAQYLIGELTEYEHYYLAPDDKDSQHRNAVWWRKDRFEMLAQGYFFLNEKDITQPIKGWGHNQFRTALWVKLRERSTGKEFFFFNTHLAHRASPVEGGDIEKESYDAKSGKLINSDLLDGLDVKEAIGRILGEIERRGLGRRLVNYRLRDAIFSRQRYWGEPFPIYYKEGTAYPLPEERLPQAPTQGQIDQALAREARAIRAKLPPSTSLVCLCVEGRLRSSEELSALVGTWEHSSAKHLAFVIGGSYGLAERLKGESWVKLSMSPMTFPHHLARVMVLEQIYRAYQINAGSGYHK